MDRVWDRLPDRDTLRLGSIAQAGRAGWRGAQDRARRSIELVVEQLAELQQQGQQGQIHDDGSAPGPGDAGNGRQRRRTRNDGMLDFPSFFTFFTSKYALLLCFLTLVINRIHHIVPPSIPYRSSTRIRALVRGPAIFLLARATFRIVSLTLRLAAIAAAAAEAGATTEGSGTASKAGYASLVMGRLAGNSDKIRGSEHADVLWLSFVACCVACASESFVRALDHDLASITPINLFTLGLLMHFHSIPYADPVVPPSGAVYALLLTQIMEVLCLHVAAVFRIRARLVVTGFFTLLSRGLMVHFWLHTDDGAHSALMPAIQSLGRILPEAFFAVCSVVTVALRALVQLIVEGRLDASIFGHASALPNRDDDFILALLKFGSACLETTAMKGLNNQVASINAPQATYVELHNALYGDGDASRGAGRRRIRQSGSVLVDHPSLPSLTQLAHSETPLSNEITTVRAVSAFPTSLPVRPSVAMAIRDGAVAPFGGVAGDNPTALGAEVDPMSRNPSLRKEIWRFVAALGLVYKVYLRRYVSMWADYCGVRRLAQGRGRIARSLRWCGIEEDGPAAQAQARSQPFERPEKIAQRLKRQLEEKRKAATAGRTDAGANDDAEEDDAEDDDYVVTDGEEEISDDAEELDDDEEEEEEEMAEEEADEELSSLQRYTARSPSPPFAPYDELNSLLAEQNEQDAGEGSDDMTTLLVAHLQAGQHGSLGPASSTSGSPLTRRRYRALTNPQLQVHTESLALAHMDPSALALSTAIANRRQFPAPAARAPATDADSAEWDESGFRTASTCVVCCSEPRSIVLWPCRCLALCDGCRAELGARSDSQGGSSLCPCCRSDVQGYSRIHVP